jgi:hypothetical protein
MAALPRNLIVEQMGAVVQTGRRLAGGHVAGRDDGRSP